MTLENVVGLQEIPSGEISISVPIDTKKYKEFLAQHSHRRAGGAIGGMLTYVFGSSVKLRCNCKGEVDLTCPEGKDSLIQYAFVNQAKYNSFVRAHSHQEITRELCSTTLGTVVVLKCADGTEEDVSDYENW